MATHPTVVPDEKEEVSEAQGARATKPVDKAAPPRKGLLISIPRRRDVLSDALLEMSPTRPHHRTMDWLLSLVLHSIFVLALILTPLYFTQSIDLRGFTQTMLVGPPPPPPPPPAAQAIVKRIPAPRHSFLAAGKLMAPSYIPEKVLILKEEPLPPDVNEGAVGVSGGVPGGVPGGQLGGVLGGIISSSSRTNVIAPPPPPAAKAPLRVGGRIKPPRLLTRIEPEYPALARQTRTQGSVVIDAVIDVQGNVVEMKVLSGHPLLIPAALDALRRWKYEPTYLNEEPVAVQLAVTIIFALQP